MPTPPQSREQLTPNEPSDDRASNFGCGVALITAGGVLLAQQLGYIKGADWLFPAILIGWGASYVYSSLRRSP